jgi:hypothetical protein
VGRQVDDCVWSWQNEAESGLAGGSLQVRVATVGVPLFAAAGGCGFNGDAKARI